MNDSGVILEHDPDTVRGPDVALYEGAESFDDLHPKYGENPPVLAVEVLLPSDKAGRIVDKLFAYVSTGVRVIWPVDPAAKAITVYRSNHQELRPTGNDEIQGGEELPGFRAAVKDVFFVPK